MNAIVNVKKASSYSKYNGLTFPVIDVLDRIICMDIDNQSVIFSHKEVIIVDIQNELQKAYDMYNWSGCRLFNKLVAYATVNKIECGKLEYNCPA